MMRETISPRAHDLTSNTSGACQSQQRLSHLAVQSQLLLRPFELGLSMCRHLPKNIHLRILHLKKAI